MPIINLQLNNKNLHNYLIGKETSLSIGRLPDNDIVIENDAVSGKHAIIISKNDEYYIEDLDSTNGTFVNKREIKSHILKDEDIITVGKHKLVFKMTDEGGLERIDVPKLSNGVISRDKTSALDTIDYREIMSKNIPDSSKATLLIFKFKGEQIRKYILKQDKQLMIGRLPDNDIVIENDAVSGKHAIITTKDDEYYIEDLDSTNGTFVNKKEIKSHMLRDEDIITIGKHELVFCIYEKCTMEETLLPYDYSTTYSTDATMALDALKIRKNALQETNPNNRSVVKKSNGAFLSFIKGGQGDVLIENKGIKIGKDPDSNIFLKGFMLGRTTVMISNTGENYYLSYRGDFKKARVNGNTIKDIIKLSDSDIIEIGSIKLIFHKP